MPEVSTCLVCHLPDASFMQDPLQIFDFGNNQFGLMHQTCAIFNYSQVPLYNASNYATLNNFSEGFFNFDQIDSFTGQLDPHKFVDNLNSSRMETLDTQPFVAASSTQSSFKPSNSQLDIEPTSVATSTAVKANIQKNSKLENLNECFDCNKKFGRPAELKRHFDSKEHKANIGDTSSSNHICNIFPCDGKTFSRNDSQMRHNRVVHPDLFN